MSTMRGKLIISTKSGASGRKSASMIASLILILFGIVILGFPGTTRHLARTFFGYGASTMPIIIIVVALFIIYPLVSLFTTFMASRSYCDVYEHAVTGMTGLSINNPKAPMQNFEIGYDEILNVTEAGKTIYIHTQYMTYEVLALKNRVEAANEIRARIIRKD